MTKIGSAPTKKLARAPMM